MEWNERLKQARKSRRWTQDVLAEKLGTNRSTISRWEQGSDFPYPVHREKLTELLGVIFDDVKASAVYQDKDSELSAVASGGEQVHNEYHTSQTLSRPGVHAHRAMHSFSSFSDTDAQSLGLRQKIFKPSASQGLVAAWTEHVVLADPVIPQTPGYANSLLGRQDLIKQVKERLLAGDDGTLIALHGLPGVGKTALAVALATDEQVQAEFGDGVLWAGLGRQPDMLGQLARWGKLLGVLPSQVEDLKSREAWRQVLRAAIGSRRFLLVIDDVCRIEDALALQIGGHQCTYLLTTHLSEVASTFASQEVLLVPPLQESEGLALLAPFIPELLEHDPQGVQALVQVLEGLPLALTLIGKYLASQSFNKQPQPLQSAVELLRITKERLETSMLTTDEYYSSLLAQGTSLCLQAAICISTQQLSMQAHTALCALAIFPPKPFTFSPEAVLAISQQPEILEELVNAGLLENRGPDCYTLHQTVTDYACAQSQSPDAQQRSVSSLEKEAQAHKQEKYTPSGHLFLSRLLRDIPMFVSPFQASKRLSWRSSVLIVSILCLCILAAIGLSAFNRLPFLNSTIPPRTTYEAESPQNTLTHGAMAASCSKCSGRHKVRYIGKESTLQFNNVRVSSAGNYSLTIYYINGDNAGTSRTLDMAVNGGTAIALQMPASGSWSTIVTLSVTVHLNAGNNTILFSNPSAYGPDMDRIVVLSDSNHLAASMKTKLKGQSRSQTIVVDDSTLGTNVNQFNYVGNGWLHCTGNNCGEYSSLYEGSNSWDQTPNDYVTVSFTGVRIRFYGVVDTLHGIGAVSIDGGKEQMIDFYSPTRAGNQLLWTSPVLSAGTHTLKLRVTGNKNPRSSRSDVVVDSVDVYTELS